MTHTIADTTFGINSQALAVLALLAQQEPDFAEYDGANGYDVDFATKPWYNGRERGIMLSMTRPLITDKVLHIAVFEHRISDDICCLNWHTNSLYKNSPDAENAIETAYGKDKTKWDVAASFQTGEIGKCAQWVYDRMEHFYDTYCKNRK
jgi:hypothetical protein